MCQHWNIHPYPYVRFWRTSTNAALNVQLKSVLHKYFCSICCKKQHYSLSWQWILPSWIIFSIAKYILFFWRESALCKHGRATVNNVMLLHLSCPTFTAPTFSCGAKSDVPAFECASHQCDLISNMHWYVCSYQISFYLDWAYTDLHCIPVSLHWWWIMEELPWNGRIDVCYMFFFQHIWCVRRVQLQSCISFPDFCGIFVLHGLTVNIFQSPVNEKGYHCMLHGTIEVIQ